MSQQSQQSTDDEEENYHICGETGGVIYEYPGCGEKLHYEDTFMVGCTSFCIGCYEEIEEDGGTELEPEIEIEGSIEIKPDPEPEIKIE